MSRFNCTKYACLAVLAVSAALVSAQVQADVDIEHKPVKKAKSGRRIPLSANVEDKTHGVDLVRTYFKEQQETRYYFVPMALKDGKFAGILPAPAFGTTFVDYLLLVKNGANEVVKSQNFTINVDDDEAAAARLQQEPPRDIRIDLDQFEEVKEALEEEPDTEPNPDSRVRVNTELSDLPTSIPGFDDFIIMSRVPEAAALGVGAATTTVAASTGGLSAATIGLGALAVGGIAGGAVAAAGGGGDSGGGGGTSPPETLPGDDGSVSSRDVSISVIDFNNEQDDFYDLFVNSNFIGAVNNPPGGTTTHEATLNSGSNLIELRLTQNNNNGTLLRIDINNGEFSREFSGTVDHSWRITAP